MNVLSRISGMSLTRSLPLFCIFPLAIVFASCGGGSTPTLQLQPGFSLTASPSAVTLVPGAAGQKVSVTATAINGFASTVAVTISGLPAGVQAQPATLTLTPGAAQSVTITAGASAAAGSATLTFSGTSGTLNHTVGVAATVSSSTAPSPDFTIAVSPGSLSLTAGAAGSTISVKATAVNGFTGTVNVAIAGLPTGVTATPASLNLTPGTAQNVTITAGSSAKTGSATLTLTATSGDLSHTASVTETVSSSSAPSPDFTIAVSPGSLSLTTGAAGSALSVKAIAMNGFTGTVNVAIAGLPAGVTANPASLNLTPGTAQNVTVTAGSSAKAGTATLTLTATSGELSHTASVTETVSSSSAPSPDFTITVSPGSLSLTAGVASSALSVKATAVNGFTGPVKVAIAGLPTGVTATPASLNLTPGTAQSTTITAGSSAVAGSATLTLTATSGSLTHTASIALTIATGTTAPSPDFTFAVSPASLSLTAGAAGSTLSVKATAVNGFTGTVKVAIAGLPAGVTANPASLNLTPGTAQSAIITAASSAAVGSSKLTFTATSGSLTHSASVALTVTAGTTTPTPDFTLSASPASLTLTAGSAGSQVSIKATALNAFTGTVSVAITGLPSGVTASPTTLSLTPGTAQTITLTASSGAGASTGTLTFTGTSGTLSHTAALVLTVQPVSSPGGPTVPDVTTYHYDLARDGLNAQETILTPANVNSSQFGKIGFDAVDGKVDAEPLFLVNVTINGQSHNVLYVATEHGSVYAFDADSGTQLWKTSVIESGETTSDDRNCSQIVSEIGITSTPVIDRKQGVHGTLFTAAMSKDSNGDYHQRLHALDLTTGAETASSPTEVAATYPGVGANSQNGNVIFDPAQYAARAALLLLNGNIYTAWTSHCDSWPYSGWLIAYSESTLQQTQVLNLTPNGGLGAIWMAGNGPAADSNGDIYLLDANGTFDTTLTNGFPAQGDFGNAMVRIVTQPKLAVADYFETYNTTSESNADLDLGSGGAILLPALKDASGATRSLIVGAGKDKNIYLADRTNLGKYNPSTSSIDSNIYQVVSGALAGSVFSTPAYFNGVLYYGAVNDALKAFPLTNAKLPSSAASQSAALFGYPGTTPAVSANASSNGIVWAVESNTGGAAVLHAYDPANLAHEYYNSTQATQNRDSFGNGNKFITPLVVNGKVYIGTQTGVAVFGLLTP